MSSYDAFYYEKYGKVAEFNFMPMNEIFETIKPINPKFLAIKNQYGNDEKIFLEKVLSFTEHKKEFTNDEFEVIVMYGECYVEKIKHVKVFAPYTSFIGQVVNYNDYDSVAASIEISRRSMILKRNNNFAMFSIVYNH